MEQIWIDEGAEALIGKPAVPLPEDVQRGLETALASMEDVAEAHLPQCFVEGTIDPPGPVLFVVFRPSANLDETMARIGTLVTDIVPAGQRFDVVSLEPRNPMLATIRKAGCCLVSAPAAARRRWWRIW